VTQIVGSVNANLQMIALKPLFLFSSQKLPSFVRWDCVEGSGEEE
jgi:hypothetical protein